ncbi:MAG: ribonuclease HII [Candidatus Moranbacteria bacterium]|nr:ribonuclease HII [Candidatus Moranbacteria bacterium]
MLNDFFKKYNCIAGIDEAGRGPLAGPVVAGVVLVDKKSFSKLKKLNLKDSKKINPEKRKEICKSIKKNFSWSAGQSDHKTIDRINILQASFLAMKRSLTGLKIKPDLIILDGKFKIPNLSIKQIAETKADETIPLVSAASIIAKVFRDELIEKLGEIYPQYLFEKHKGYGTKEHLDALKKFGPCPIHRKSFKPVKNFQ